MFEMRLGCRAADGAALQKPQHAAQLAILLWNIQARDLRKLLAYLLRQEPTGGKRRKYQGMQKSRWAKIPRSYKRQQKNRVFSRRSAESGGKGRKRFEKQP